MARARAVRILRRDLRRPKRRSTRRARITRAMPVGSLVRTRETSDMPTTNMSSQHQGSAKKGTNHEEKATKRSSAVKIMVKKTLARARAAPKLVSEPLASTRSLAYCDSSIVQMKLCARPALFESTMSMKMINIAVEQRIAYMQQVFAFPRIFMTSGKITLCLFVSVTRQAQPLNEKNSAAHETYSNNDQREDALADDVLVYIPNS